MNLEIFPTLLYLKDKKCPFYTLSQYNLCKSCRFSWKAAIWNLLNILNIFINAKYPSISIITLSYPHWICILIWNTLKQHPETQFSRHEFGEHTVIACPWQDRSWLPFRRGPATTCVSKQSSPKAWGHFRDTAWCCSTAARSPIPSGTGVSLEPVFSQWW